MFVSLKSFEISNNNLKKNLTLTKGFIKTNRLQSFPKVPNYSHCAYGAVSFQGKLQLYLSDDHVSDAMAVSFHSEDLVVVAGGDVELDSGAAAVGVVGIRGRDGDNCVSHSGVLC